MVIRLFIIIIFCFIIYITFLQYERIINYYYIKNLRTIKYIKKYRIDQGPYVLKDGTKIYEYNPSIYQLNNGDIIYTSRISGHCKKDREIKCKNMLKNEIYNKEIDDAFSLFPINFINCYSHSIIRNITKNKSQIIPFKRKHLENIEKKIINNLGCEDPRLFYYNNRDWAYFHYIGKDILNNSNKVGKYITIVTLDNLDNFIYLYTDNMKRTEKNWMPFEYNNELYFEYSIQPHIILKANLDSNGTPTGYCPKVYNTKINYPKKRDFGGGAPSIKIKLNGKYYFLGIAHTRGKTSSVTTRKNLFYIFRSEPPFDILWIGPEFNILDKTRNIDFATGLIVKNEKQSDKIDDYNVIVSYGIEDCCGYVNEYKLNDIISNNFV